MANLKQIRTALVGRIESLCQVSCQPYVPDSIVPPVVLIGYGGPASITFGGTMSEQAEVMGLPGAPPSPTAYRLQLIVLVSRAVSEQAQADLDELVDAGASRATGLYSIPDALMSDDQLGGVVEWCVPLDVTMPGLHDIAGQEYFGCGISIQVSA